MCFTTVVQAHYSKMFADLDMARTLGNFQIPKCFCANSRTLGESHVTSSLPASLTACSSAQLAVAAELFVLGRLWEYLRAPHHGWSQCIHLGASSSGMPDLAWSSVRFCVLALQCHCLEVGAFSTRHGFPLSHWLLIVVCVYFFPLQFVIVLYS